MKIIDDALLQIISYTEMSNRFLKITLFEGRGMAVFDWRSISL